jgi:hypothetical protein
MSRNSEAKPVLYFLGHTVLKEVTQVGNCTFLDTGGCFKKHDNGYDLSIVKLSDYC